MDPITLGMTAVLSAGAASKITEAARKTTVGGYERLKALIKKEGERSSAMQLPDPGRLLPATKLLRAAFARGRATSLLILATVLGQACPAPAAAVTQLSPQEQYVLKSAVGGEEADFAASPWKDRPKVSSLFLSRLLRGEFKNVSWRGVRIRHAVFSEPLDLEAADVPYNTFLRECVFQERVNFRFTHFAKSLNLSESEFQGAVSLGQVSIAGELDARGVKFAAVNEADFQEMQVGHNADFSSAVFRGPANFVNAEIGEELMLDHAEFLSEGEQATPQNAMQRRGAIFNVTKVGQMASFVQTTFVGPVDFRYFEVGGGLTLDGVHFEEKNQPSLFQFLRADILFIDGVSFAGPVDFQEARVGTLQIKNTSVKDIDLVGMHVGRLQELGLQTPNGETRKVSVQGMTYDFLGNPSQLSQLIDESQFRPQNYSALEAYYKAHGCSECGDDVFVQMKRRERSAASWTVRPWNWLLDVLVRYGRSPERAFYVAFLVVVFGVLVFRRRSDVQAQRSEDQDKYYNPFWYSLDLLVPAIDLQAANVWAPRQGSRFRRNYARLHRILGWVLIPIGLAAVSGLIR